MPNNYTATKRRPRFFVSRLLSPPRRSNASLGASRIPLYKNLVVLLTTLGGSSLGTGRPAPATCSYIFRATAAGSSASGALEPRNPPPSPSASLVVINPVAASPASRSNKTPVVVVVTAFTARAWRWGLGGAANAARCALPGAPSE